MNITESLKPIGEYTVRVKGEDDNYKEFWVDNKLGMLTDLKIPYVTGHYAKEETRKNLIVNDGLAALASLLNGDGGEAAFTYIAVGSGSTAEAATDSALGTEITASGLSRASATVSRETQNVTNDMAVLTNSFSVTASETVNEIGIFNAGTGGTMFSRKVISTKNVTSGDTLEITYKVYSS